MTLRNDLDNIYQQIDVEQYKRKYSDEDYVYKELLHKMYKYNIVDVIKYCFKNGQTVIKRECNFWFISSIDSITYNCLNDNSSIYFRDHAHDDYSWGFRPLWDIGMKSRNILFNQYKTIILTDLGKKVYADLQSLANKDNIHFEQPFVTNRDRSCSYEIGEKIPTSKFDSCFIVLFNFSYIY